MDTPKKLKKDAIIEVICEVRFDSNEVPELILAKLIATPIKRSFIGSRTPYADIPAPMRIMNENLRYQPIMDFRSPENGNTIIRIGNTIFSYNNTSPYKGWTQYFSELTEVLGEAFVDLKNLRPNKITLRYINSLNSTDHFINKISDLNLKIVAGDNPVTDSYNLNFSKNLSDNHEVTIRISSPNFVQGLPTDTVALVDIEVTTKNADKFQNLDNMLEWLSDAHSYEKKEFFNLIPNDVLTKLRED